ncbi:hypothetical protein Tsubulata_023755, partial [Turnera subulata]
MFLEVGMIAVNDGLLLPNHVSRILREKPYYADLLDLFNEVEFQTASDVHCCSWQVRVLVSILKQKNILVEMGIYFQVQGVFAEYESKSYEKLIKSIEAHPSKGIQAVLKSFLAKIHKRQKQ